MPRYACLFDWTDQAMKTVKGSVERVDGAAEVARSKYGVSLEHVYWTMGEHDILGIFEAPDEESMSAFLLELGSLGERAQHHDAGVRPRGDGLDHREGRLTRGRPADTGVVTTTGAGRLPPTRPGPDSRQEVPPRTKHDQQYRNRARFAVRVDLPRHEH
jgi:uncharacterized protein with GYD domain